MVAGKANLGLVLTGSKRKDARVMSNGMVEVTLDVGGRVNPTVLAFAERGTDRLSEVGAQLKEAPVGAVISVRVGLGRDKSGVLRPHEYIAYSVTASA